MWAYGLTSAYEPFLLRSTDEANSWHIVEINVSGIPTRGVRILSLKFVNGTVGLLAMQSQTGLGPFLAITRDGGSSWAGLDEQPLPEPGRYLLSVRSGSPLLLSVNRRAPRVQRMEAWRGEIVHPTASLLDGRSFVTDSGDETSSATSRSSAGEAFLPPLDPEGQIGSIDQPFWPSSIS